MQLAVLAATGIAVGSVLLGVYATPSVNPSGPDGSARQALIQVVGVLVAVAWSAAGTLLVMLTSERLVSTRIDEEDESRGLDSSQHGESSYHLVEV